MIYLVTGGSGSGKSEYAEQLAAASHGSPRIYLATMMVLDEDGQQRVNRHLAMRAGKGFITEERFYDLGDYQPKSQDAVILLECMSNLLCNEYYREKKDVSDRIFNGLVQLSGVCRDLIIVTNEVFSDGIRYDQEMEEYLRIWGELNCRLGRLADSVTEVVCGCPVKIK